MLAFLLNNYYTLLQTLAHDSQSYSSSDINGVAVDDMQ